MPSTFGWVDFSDKERRQMLDVVHLFSDRETRDELGIGTIRDAFADYFFPGTSTIQTRVKYMLLIPWIYLDLERKRVPSARIAARARKVETDLIETLLQNGEEDGVIGQDARRNLVRLPSSVYWSGLESWGIRLFPRSREQYHRYLDTYYLHQKAGFGSEADEELAEHRKSTNWQPGLPQPPINFMQSAGLDLTNEEAGYLKERILIHHPDSLLACLLKQKRTYKADFPWEHPVAQKLEPVLTTDLQHARDFSQVIHGAALLYNLMLAQAADMDQKMREYEKKLTDWKEKIRLRHGELKRWFGQMGNFWDCSALSQARIPKTTRAFATRWLQLVFFSPGIRRVVNSNDARSLIAQREVFLKRNRARLTNQNALKRWRGASGTRRLSYRWQTAAIFVGDILKGLYRR